MIHYGKFLKVSFCPFRPEAKKKKAHQHRNRLCLFFPQTSEWAHLCSPICWSCVRSSQWVTVIGRVRKRALLHGVWFSYWSPESDGATGSCGLEDAAAAAAVAHCRPLFISSPPHTALLHGDNGTGTDGRLGAEHLMKHTFFFFFF